MLYNYLRENYALIEPKFFNDIVIPGLPEENVRYHLKNIQMMAFYADLKREYIIFLKQMFSEKRQF